MLYNKNKSKELDKELFRNPTSEYRGAPFWSWNCKLDEARLRKQIEENPSEPKYIKNKRGMGYYID